MSLIVAVGFFPDGSKEICCWVEGWAGFPCVSVFRTSLSCCTLASCHFSHPHCEWMKRERWLFSSAPLTDVWYCFSSRGLSMAWIGTDLRQWSRRESCSSPPLSYLSLFPLLHDCIEDMRRDLLFLCAQVFSMSLTPCLYISFMSNEGISGT